MIEYINKEFSKKNQYRDQYSALILFYYLLFWLVYCERLWSLKRNASTLSSPLRVTLGNIQSVPKQILFPIILSPSVDWNLREDSRNCPEHQKLFSFLINKELLGCYVSPFITHLRLPISGWICAVRNTKPNFLFHTISCISIRDSENILVLYSL